MSYNVHRVYDVCPLHTMVCKPNVFIIRRWNMLFFLSHHWNMLFFTSLGYIYSSSDLFFESLVLLDFSTVFAGGSTTLWYATAVLAGASTIM